MAYSILVIDDTQRIRDIIKFFLEGEGYIVKMAADPHEGIKIAQNGDVQLILLDIMMPQLDGYQVYHILKQDERTREIPVIMLTAKAVIRNTAKDFFYGLYGFLAKPFSKAQLLGMVKKVLNITHTGKTTEQIHPTQDIKKDEEIIGDDDL